MSIKKLGNENNYIEYNNTMSFGVKKDYEKAIFKNIQMVETKNGKMTKFSDLPFEETPEGMLLIRQLTKIVEDGKVIAEGKGITPDIVYNDVINADNFEKLIIDVKKANKIGIEKEDEELKK